VINDGSNDGTDDLMNKITDSRVRYFKQSNSGRSSARNAALKASRGDLITFLDSDDLYRPNKLSQQVEFFDKYPQYSVVYSAADCFLDDDLDEIMMTYTANCSGMIYDKIALYLPNPICLPTVMIKREVIDRVGFFDVELDRFEDIDYWRRISKYYEFGAIQSSLCLIRTHKDNEISNLKMRILSKQVIHYCQKVISEDLELFPEVLKVRIPQILNHYALAIASNSSAPFWCFRIVFKWVIFCFRGIGFSNSGTFVTHTISSIMKILLGRAKAKMFSTKFS
jgi:glycosyltransferase involved in cell wall biosynthesis